MAHTGEVLNKMFPVLEKMPAGIYFDAENSPGNLAFQAHTQAEVATIKKHFRGLVWKRTWGELNKWWEYTTQHDGITVEIYAITEAPAQCKAITEVRTVEKQVPVSYKTEVVEEEVIVGWDCKGGKNDLADNE